MKIWMLRAALALSPFLVSACGDDDSDTRLEEGLAIVGSYTDDFDGDHEITEAAWTSGDSVFHITDYDNAERWVIAENDEDNEWNPGLFSRFDWAPLDSKLYFCQTAYDAKDEATARATEAADSSDLEEGCGGFSWSELIKK